MLALAVALAAGYLLGSISCGILVSKAFRLPDPRTQGSGNAGATNVLRSSGKIPAILVLVGDVLKGLLAIMMGFLLVKNSFALGLVALAAVIGHVFPVFFRFKGGKGVATAAGTLFALSPLVLILSAVVWAGVLVFRRFVSLASIIATAVTPFFLLLTGQADYFIQFALIAGLIIWKHQSNIQRLRAGTENKLYP